MIERGRVYNRTSCFLLNPSGGTSFELVAGLVKVGFGSLTLEKTQISRLPLFQLAMIGMHDVASINI